MFFIFDADRKTTELKLAQPQNPYNFIIIWELIVLTVILIGSIVTGINSMVTSSIEADSAFSKMGSLLNSCHPSYSEELKFLIFHPLEF